ncbi:MAG: hypothetical protein U0414_37350 [Polyangiaceae bacterium]
MRPTSKKNRLRRPLLAAPLVVTAALTPGCGNGGTVYSNPGYPEDPSAHPTTSASAPATATPVVSASTAPSTPSSSSAATAPTTSAPPRDEEPLAEIPKNGGGKVVKQPDGSCKYVFPVEDVSCPPTVHCNPGPPQKPIKVKCPPDGKTQP